MAIPAEVQELLVRLGLDDSKYQAGLKRVEAANLGLQRQAALMRTYAQEQAALSTSISARQAQVLRNIPMVTRAGTLAAREVSNIFDKIDRQAAQAERAAARTLTGNRRIAAQYAAQGLRDLETQARTQQRYAAREAALGEQALARRAALSKQAWAAEVAGIQAAAAAQSRLNEIRASQTVSARFNQGLTGPTSRLGQIGVTAATGGLKFLERSFLATAAAGVVLESQFFKVSDAQAAMARTLDGESAPAIARINADILALSRVVPLPITELYRLAEVAGTVGIAGKDIAQFTDIVARMAATTDLTADDAAKQLGRMLNVMSLTVDQTDNLASALLQLSISQASSDQEILTATERFGALGTAMGFTAAQLLAIGSAGTALGQEPEAVGGSLQRIFSIFNKLLGQEKVTDKLKDFARISGLTVDELRQQWATNPMVGFEKFLQGFGDLTPQQQAQLFGSGELFPSFVRGQQTLQNLSAQLGLLKEGVDTASGAFADGNLIFELSSQRFDTLKNNLQLLKNAAVEAGYTFGAAFDEEMGGAIKQITQYIIDSLPAIERFGKQVGRFIEGIDWGRAKAYADAFFGTIKTGFDIVASLPPELLALLGAFKAFNFLSGGALGGITSSFASGIGGVIKNSLAELFKGTILQKAFVQPVFVTNPGFGTGSGVGGTGLGSLIAKVFVVGMAAEAINLLAGAIVPQINRLFGTNFAAGTDPMSFLHNWNEWWQGVYSASKDIALTLHDLLGTGFGHQPAPPIFPPGSQAFPFGSDLNAQRALNERQMQLAQYMMNASKDDAVTAEQLSAASANLLAATKKWLDALKPRHREGEVGKSRQSAEVRAIDRLDVNDPNYITKLTTYVQDLVDHYRKEPLGSKNHPAEWVRRTALRPVAQDLKAQLKQAIKDGNEDQKTAIVAQLKALDGLPNFKLPPGIRRLINRVEASQEAQKETKTATNKVKSAVTDASDRIENLTAALRRKKLSTTVNPKWSANVRAPSVRIGGTTVRVTIGARTVTRYLRGTVAYGPGYVLMQTGTGGAAVYSGGGGY